MFNMSLKCFQVIESEEFVLLPVCQLVDIISSDELNVRSEEQVFSAVMSWVKYNVSERRQHLSQVLFSYIMSNISEVMIIGCITPNMVFIIGRVSGLVYYCH